MPITLNLGPDAEGRLRDLAAARGISVSEYVREFVEREAALVEFAWSNGQEKARAFLEWADSFPDTPRLSDEAINRANMHPDRF